MRALAFGLVRLLSVVACLPLLSACDGSAPRTTVMVYMVGSDLEGDAPDAAFGSQSIEQMLQASRSDGLEVLLETGGSQLSHGPLGIDWTHVRRYQVSHGELRLLQDLGPDDAVDMARSATLAGFVSWAGRFAPASRSVLILWGHGGGPNGGFGVDDITGHTLSLRGLVSALQAAPARLDLLGFWSCQMGSAEVAAALAPYARTLVASEDLMLVPGFNFTALLDFLEHNPQAGGAAIGRVMTDSYVDADMPDPITLSVVDLDRMPALVRAMDAFSRALQPYATSSMLSWRTIAEARSRSLDFSAPNLFDARAAPRDLVDLRQLVDNIDQAITRAIGPDAALDRARAQTDAALDAAVLYTRGTAGDADATGLSVYFPAILSLYPQVDYASQLTLGGGDLFSAPYATALLPAYFASYLAWRPGLQANLTVQPVRAASFDASIENPFRYTLVAAGKMSCRLAQTGADGAPRPCLESMQMAQDYSHAKGSALWHYRFALPGRWPMLYGQPISLIPDVAVFKGQASIRYLVPVYLDAREGPPRDDNPGTPFPKGFLRVEPQQAGGRTVYRVVGIQRLGDAASMLLQLAAGERYFLADFAPDASGRWRFQRSSRSITLRSPTPEVSMGTLAPAPDRTLDYVVDDVTGELSLGPPQPY